VDSDNAHNRSIDSSIHYMPTQSYLTVIFNDNCRSIATNFWNVVEHITALQNDFLVTACRKKISNYQTYLYPAKADFQAPPSPPRGRR
jgi:deoxyxylulose-5-phosphate synthase